MRKHQKRKLRSYNNGIMAKELVRLPKKRKISATSQYLSYLNQLKKEQKKVREDRHWNRSIQGNLFVRADNLIPDLDDHKEFLKSVQESRDYYDKPCEFDTPPKKATPKKAVTTTPRKRIFKNILKIVIEKMDKSKLVKKIRLLVFQEEKIPVPESAPSKVKEPVSDHKKLEKLEKLRKRLAIFQDPQDESKIEIKRHLNKGTLTRARNSPKPRRGKDHISADDIFSHYIKEQKNVNHELSHLIPRSQGGGPDCVLPTTEGHNSKRIPIEVLARFFVLFGLSVEFKAVARLLKNQYGFIPIPDQEEIHLSIANIGIKLIFSLDPLCPLPPVYGCYQVTEKIALYSLKGTNFFEKADTQIKKREQRRNDRWSRPLRIS